MIKIGLCGFSMAMREYPRHFPVVEVQQTFYEPPRAAVMKRWIATAPASFEFTMKAWQLITHEASSPTYRRLRTDLSARDRAACGAFRDSNVVRMALERTLDAARCVNATVVVFQCPARFRPERESVNRLRHFFTKIANPRCPLGMKYAWEPRGKDWTEQAGLAHELCAELDLIHVVARSSTRFGRGWPRVLSVARDHGRAPRLCR